MAIILDGTNGETFPSWSTAGRPTSPATGQVGYNTTLNTLETYNGTTWVAGGLPAPSTSGNVLTSDGTNWTSSAGAVGVGQIWAIPSPTRVSGTTYTNSTGKPIQVLLSISCSYSTSSSTTLIVVVGGVTIVSNSYSATQGGLGTVYTVSFIVPSGSTYVATVTGSQTIQRWAELS
jgi:hypothetical protein